MVQLGYALSSEEFRPNELVDNAVQAEETGFPYALISDHFHPWMDSQGQSPFVWSTIGGIAQRTSQLRLGTGVTAPIIRIHPAIIAQAAATVADMMPGRFFLGVGTGELLNEHITGEHWPPISIRQEMLAEAVEIIRQLWQGGYQTIDGDYYTVENARLYTLPETLPDICVAASGPESATLADRIGDGLVCTSPQAETVQAFNGARGKGKPTYGQMTVCWAKTEDEGLETALKYWAYTGLPGQLSQELALPQYFQEAAQLVTKETIGKSVVAGPDAEKYHQKIQSYIDAGFTHVYLHQIGPDQAGFFDFARRELLPKYQGA
ncbi:MAG TPA: TIGR03557 family F420-dependent LLM class oxidoreductase [Thermomicrobiales bacterium]|nr:TIGR03557 family F420-dependent LLM class oxidoreductase [Thermomicrobiales bacterium]